MELASEEVFFRAMQKVFAAIVVVEVEGVFSLPPIVEYTGGRRSFGGVIPIGSPGHVTPGARRRQRALVSGGFEILLAVKNCDRVRREKEAVYGGKIVLDVDTHGGEERGSCGESYRVVGGDDGGVSVFAAFCPSSGGPLDMSVFYRIVVT